MNDVCFKSNHLSIQIELHSLQIALLCTPNHESSYACVYASMCFGWGQDIVEDDNKPPNKEGPLNELALAKLHQIEPYELLVYLRQHYWRFAFTGNILYMHRLMLHSVHKSPFQICDFREVPPSNAHS